MNLTGNATNVTRAAREPLVAAAKRHGMLPIALMVATPGTVCVERQGPRPANRTVPEATVLKQRKDMVDSHRGLKSEGFIEVAYSESSCQLLPFLKRLSEARRADLGQDGGDGLGSLLLVRRMFGPEILPLWKWKDGSNIATWHSTARTVLGLQAPAREMRHMRCLVCGEASIKSRPDRDRPRLVHQPCMRGRGDGAPGPVRGQPDIPAHHQCRSGNSPVSQPHQSDASGPGAGLAGGCRRPRLIEAAWSSAPAPAIPDRRAPMAERAFHPSEFPPPRAPLASGTSTTVWVTAGAGRSVGSSQGSPGSPTGGSEVYQLDDGCPPGGSAPCPELKDSGFARKRRRRHSPNRVTPTPVQIRARPPLTRRFVISPPAQGIGRESASGRVSHRLASQSIPLRRRPLYIRAANRASCQGQSSTPSSAWVRGSPLIRYTNPACGARRRGGPPATRAAVCTCSRRTGRREPAISCLALWRAHPGTDRREGRTGR